MIIKQALLVGIDDYPHSPLNGCINDARKLQPLLERNGDGSENFDVKLEEDVAGRAPLKKLLVDLFNREADAVLFYFSGHGASDELGVYLMTPDAEQYDKGVSLDDVLKIAHGSKVRNKIIILDCCYAGAMGAVSYLKNKTLLDRGITILAASREKQPAVQEDGESVFTRALIKGLEGAAANSKGNITMNGLYDFIHTELGNWGQTPVYKTDIAGRTVIRTVEKKSPGGTGS